MFVLVYNYKQMHVNDEARKLFAGGDEREGEVAKGATVRRPGHQHSKI